MKHYVNLATKQVFGYEEDGSQDSLIAPELTPMSTAEFDEFTKKITFIPTRVDMRQARLALLAANLLDTVESNVATMPKAAQIEWEFAATVVRTSPLVDMLAGLLTLDTAALDKLFTDASKL